MNFRTWMQEVFDRAAPIYGEKGCRYFDDFGKKLVALAHLRSGDKILDIAMGKGAVLFPASQAIGKTGKAIGIDLSPKMVEAAKKRNPFSFVELHVMDAEKLAFSSHFFDVVFCAFALFFFPNSSSVLDEFKRVLKQDGRLAVSSFGQSSSLSGWVISRAKELGALKVFKINPLDTVESVHEALKKANFKQIEVQEKEEIVWHESKEAWWQSLWSHGIRALLEQLGGQEIACLQKEALEYVNQFVKNGRVEEKVKVIYGIARK